MRQLVRENALCVLLAGAATAAMAWLGLYGYAWNDYETEARAAFAALAHGHVVEFLRLSPAYGGSLVERAPFALLPGLWGGGDLAVYRMVALPCLLAAAALGVWLVAGMRARGRSPLSRAVALGLCVANPLTLRALEVGHPEELLGACFCVAAVLLASRDRPLAAGVLLGLAIANKEWALLAVGPVLLALPTRRIACLALSGAVALAVLAPLALVSSGGFLAGTRGVAAPPASIFQPWQVWWFLGHHGALVHGLFGSAKVGYRIAPSWVGPLSHPLILLAGLLITASMWSRRRDGGRALLVEPDALLVLALLLVLRCVLDTWDTDYYPLPFLFALLAWEARGPAARPPVLALASTALAWLTFQWSPAHVSADAQAALFLTWSLPLVGLLLFAAYRPEGLINRYQLLRQARKPLTPALLHDG
jgi:glycosyl transferase family 87